VTRTKVIKTESRQSLPYLCNSADPVLKGCSMRKLAGLFAFGVVAITAFTLAAQGQDEPSLGDVARQARQQKQKDAPPAKGSSAPAKDAATKAPVVAQAAPDAPKDAASQPKPQKRVITNDEIPEHIGPTSTLQNPSRSNSNYSEPTYPANNNPGVAEQWKSSILAMKSNIASMQSQIKSLEDSVHYASGNCVQGCVQWNEQQQQKQQEVENMKQQLEQQQKQLETAQEQARRQGFGSSVYDP